MNSPISVFDSGVGGLTVVKEIIKQLPNENIIYLGDSARVPYGTRDSATIRKFADELVKFIMLRKRVKAILVACNTMSAVALSDIRCNFADSCFCSWKNQGNSIGVDGSFSGQFKKINL